MEGRINKLILEELEKDKASPAVKDLLRDILVLESKHAAEPRYRYTKDYEPLILKALAQLSQGARK